MNTQNYAVNIRVGLANPARVNISQGDTGRTLAFSLYDGLSSFTPPTGSTVTIVGRKPSKLGFSEACTVSGNVATVTTTLAMTQEAGKFPVELRIEANGESIGTANFTMYIEPSPHPDGTTDGTHATVDNLQTQIGNLANLATTAKTNLVSAINEAAQSGGVVIDDTLTQTGQAADAKKTGDEISAIKADLEGLEGGGLTADIKSALLACFNHVVWDDDDPTGQSYIDALEDALYPPAELARISAVYTQSGTVYDTDSLDDLKSDIVVTAHYDDNTSETVTTYTLSGTLTAGTSTVTVTYGGKTTTFSVTVTANPYLAYWDFTQSLVDTVNGYEFTLSCGSLGTLERTSEGLVFSCPDTGGYNANAQLPNTVTFPKGSKLTIEFGASDAQMTKNSGDKGSTYGFGNGSLMGGVASIFWRGSGDKFYSYGSSWTDRWIPTAPDYFNNKTLVIEVASDRTRTLTVDGVAFGTVPGSAISSDTYTFFFGRKASDGQTFHNIKIKKVYVETLSS